MCIYYPLACHLWALSVVFYWGGVASRLPYVFVYHFVDTDKTD